MQAKSSAARSPQVTRVCRMLPGLPMSQLLTVCSANSATTAFVPTVPHAVFVSDELSSFAWAKARSFQCSSSLVTFQSRRLIR